MAGHITVDTEKLAQGMYNLHLEMCGDSLALHLGMLDAGLMQSLEGQLKERIPDKFYFAGHPLEERDGKRFREKVLHDVCVLVLQYAKRDGILTL